MTHRPKILVDRFIGAPAAYVLSLMARLPGIILHNDHTIRPEDVQCIVIAQFLGMGSILQTTALIRELKASFPDANVLFVTSRSTRSLLERLDGIDKILCIDDRGALRLLFEY